MRCCVPFCKTTAEIVSETKEITFHKFPREVHLRAAWLRALGKQDALLPAGAVVCSQHFLNDEILKTENGSRQIRTGAIPATVLICLICLDTRKELLLMSEYKLEQAYQDLVGHPPCAEGRLKHTLCVQCAKSVVDFSTFRDESLRARCLMMELLHTHKVITRRHVALLNRYKRPLPSDIEPDTAPNATATATDATDVAVAVKQEVEDLEDVDTAACAYNADSIATAARALREHCEAREDAPAAAEAATETQLPIKREYICKLESSEERNQALAPVVLATNPGNVKHPTGSSDYWDMSSFEKNANVLDDARKSQDAGLIPKEELAKISDSIDYRTRRDDSLTNEQRKHSQGIFSTLLGNHTDRKVSLVSDIRTHAFAKTLSSKMSTSEMSSDCEIGNTPPDITERGNIVANNLLPEKSRHLYEKCYEDFVNWQETSNVPKTSLSENVLLVYFEECAKKFQPSTLWTRYSMLRSVLNIKHKIELSTYTKLIAFLKRKSEGFKGKKAKSFTTHEIKKFLDQAPSNYLLMKVALIIGIMGACRRNELYQLKFKELKDIESAIVITIPTTKTKTARTFTITGKFAEFCREYMMLRPKNCNSPYFFLNYVNGKCTTQRVGINKLGSLGKTIASYLKLPNPELYTGHCFRRSSATLLVDAGGDLTDLKRHGGWKSTSVAEGRS